MRTGTIVSRGVFMFFLSFLVFAGLMRNCLAEEKATQPAAEEKAGAAAPQTEELSFGQSMSEHRLKAWERLAELEKKIRELEAEAQMEGAEAKEDTKKKLRELRQKKAEVKKDLRRLESSGKNTWERIMEKVDAGLLELQKAIGKVREYLRSGK